MGALVVLSSVPKWPQFEVHQYRYFKDYDKVHYGVYDIVQYQERQGYMNRGQVVECQMQAGKECAVSRSLLGFLHHSQIILTAHDNAHCLPRAFELNLLLQHDHGYHHDR
jgi:hypothetical protein